MVCSPGAPQSFWSGWALPYSGTPFLLCGVLSSGEVPRVWRDIRACLLRKANGGYIPVGLTAVCWRAGAGLLVKGLSAWVPGCPWLPGRSPLHAHHSVGAALRSDPKAFVPRRVFLRHGGLSNGVSACGLPACLQRAVPSPDFPRQVLSGLVSCHSWSCPRLFLQSGLGRLPHACVAGVGGHSGVDWLTYQDGRTLVLRHQQVPSTRRHCSLARPES